MKVYQKSSQLLINKKIVKVVSLKIWIDISNAPHVRFFKDVIKYLESEGEDLIITARDFGL